MAEGGGRRRDAHEVGAFLTGGGGAGAGTAGAGGGEEGASVVDGEGTTTVDFGVEGDKGAGDEDGMVAGGEGADTEAGVGGEG